MTTHPTLGPPPVVRDEPKRSPAGAMSVRAAAVGGTAFFTLLMIFGSLTNGTPAASDTRREVFDHLTRYHGQLQVAAVAYGLAMPAALLFLSGLFGTLRAAEGGRPRLAIAALGGGILAATSSVTGALILGTVATRYADLGPAGSRVFWTMFLLSIGATLLGQLLMIGTTAAISLRTQLFPRWFGLASAVLAAASAVGAATIGSPGVGLQSTAGITVIADAVWILLVGRYLWRRPEAALP